MMFKTAATLAGIFNLAIAPVWYFAPDLIIEIWGVENTSPGAVIERRLGVMLLFIGVLLLAARNAGPSPARSAISYASICAALALAATSSYESWTGATTAGVLPAVGVNLLFASWFGLIEWGAYRDRKEKAD